VGGRVLITRPQPGAAQTAERLETLRFEPACLPLTEIRPTFAGLPARCEFDAVAIPSANAIRHTQPALLRAVVALPAFAVGRATAEAATKAGFKNTTVGPGYGQGLATLMAGRLARGTRVIYMCGHVRTRGFEETLREAGIEVTPVEVYDTVTLDYSDEELRAVLGSKAFDTVLLYSRIAARFFLELTDRSVMLPLLDRATLVCMSERVAEPLSSFGDERIRIAAEPNEEAMLARLAG
jgi:uroporphyrinogen-III synthase